MQTEGRVILRELREDHRNMAIVLDVLAEVIEEAAAGNDPDFELVDEIMRYMTVYPDAVHHPKEDILYAQLQRERPDLADGLDDVPADHHAIAELGTALRDDVEAINAGGAVRREKLVEDMSNYVDRLRRHMNWEEGDLFKRIDSMLDDQDRAVDVSQFEHSKDPIFDLEIESGFQRLMSSLQR